MQIEYHGNDLYEINATRGWWISFLREWLDFYKTFRELRGAK